MKEIKHLLGVISSALDDIRTSKDSTLDEILEAFEQLQDEVEDQINDTQEAIEREAVHNNKGD